MALMENDDDDDLDPEEHADTDLFVDACETMPTSAVKELPGTSDPLSEETFMAAQAGAWNSAFNFVSSHCDTSTAIPHDQGFPAATLLSENSEESENSETHVMAVTHVDSSARRRDGRPPRPPRPPRPSSELVSSDAGRDSHVSARVAETTGGSDTGVHNADLAHQPAAVCRAPHVA